MPTAGLASDTTLDACGADRYLQGSCKTRRKRTSCDASRQRARSERRTVVATTTGSSTRTYKIDKSHSEAIFQVRHLLTKVRGRFSDFEGTVEFNEASPDQSSVNFTI